jgi:hypothetical protein
MPSGTEREQVGVPGGKAGTQVAPLGPTTTLRNSYTQGNAQTGLYGVVDRKTPAMADGSLHGKINNLTHRGSNFDGAIDV